MDKKEKLVFKYQGIEGKAENVFETSLDISDLTDPSEVLEQTFKILYFLGYEEDEVAEYLFALAAEKLDNLNEESEDNDDEEVKKVYLREKLNTELKTEEDKFSNMKDEKWMANFKEKLMTNEKFFKQVVKAYLASL